ncbi:MAG: outer-membrane lipoprotein carrier protein LolA [Sphingomonadales bacterium]|jgi:outer membrane lipoprotein-sorting protein
MKSVRNAFKLTLIVVFSLVIGISLGFGLLQMVNAAELPQDQTLETVDLTKEPLLAHERDAKADVLTWLRDVKALKSNFVQIGPDGRTTSGTMYLERPGKIRFEYEGNNEILIVADGKTLNLIDYEVDQVTSWPVKDTPLALLLQSDVDLEDHILVSEPAAGPLAGTIAVSAEDPKRPEYGTVTFLFSRVDQDEIELKAWRVMDAQGLTTTVTLAEAELNIDVDDKVFTFKDPRKSPVQRPRRAG